MERVLRNQPQGLRRALRLSISAPNAPSPGSTLLLRSVRYGGFRGVDVWIVAGFPIAVGASGVQQGRPNVEEIRQLDAS